MATNFFTDLEIKKIGEFLNLADLHIDVCQQTPVQIHQKVQETYSISHCLDFGGFISTQKNVGIGFDIELIDRVSRQVANRITPEGLDNITPSAAWCAKEACFKSLKKYTQPQTLSLLELTEWKTLDSQSETFCLKDYQKWNIKNFRGLCLRKGHYQFAFAVSCP